MEFPHSSGPMVPCIMGRCDTCHTDASQLFEVPTNFSPYVSYVRLSEIKRSTQRGIQGFRASDILLLTTKIECLSFVSSI